MPYREAAALIRRCQLEEAQRFCLDDYQVNTAADASPTQEAQAAESLAYSGELMAMGHARELLWITVPSAGRWAECRRQLSLDERSELRPVVRP